MLGVHPLPVRVVLGQVDEVQHDHAVRQRQRSLHRVGQPAARRLLDVQPVDNDLDGVLLVLLQRWQLAGDRRLQPDDRAVDPRPGKALDLEFPEHLGVLALAPADDRREDLEPGPLVELEHPVHDLLRGLPRDRPTANRAVRLAYPGEQQPQVVVDLGNRADGGPRVAPGCLLVDRDGGRQPVDEVNVGLVHLAEELAGIGRQRLDVPSLALGEDGVEGQARLTGAGQPGKHDHGVPRQVERDILKVVLAGTADDKAICHYVPSSPGMHSQLTGPQPALPWYPGGLTKQGAFSRPPATLIDSAPPAGSQRSHSSLLCEGKEI